MSMTDSELRADLLATYGPCVCRPDGCTGEAGQCDVPPGTWCPPCGHLDIYADCFVETGQASGRTQLYRDDARYCNLTRAGLRHDDHIYRYKVAFLCGRQGGKVSGAAQHPTGEYYCAGLPEATEPWPPRPLTAVRS